MQFNGLGEPRRACPTQHDTHSTATTKHVTATICWTKCLRFFYSFLRLPPGSTRINCINREALVLERICLLAELLMCGTVFPILSVLLVYLLLRSLFGRLILVSFWNVSNYLGQLSVPVLLALLSRSCCSIDNVIMLCFLEQINMYICLYVTIENVRMHSTEYSRNSCVWRTSYKLSYLSYCVTPHDIQCSELQL